MDRTDTWQLMPRRHASPVMCDLIPDASLRRVDSRAGPVWESTGDHAGFRFGAPVSTDGLPAGWYALRGRIECLDGVVTLPSLRPGYEQGGVVDDGEIPLPDPEASGEIRALVLFKYPVSALCFCPGVWAARFRMHGLRLERVSRMAALWMMLRGTGQGFLPRVILRRGLAFVARLCTSGLRAATTEAFDDYLTHQRPVGLTDYDVWIRKYDTFTPSRLAVLHERASAIGTGDVSLSVLLPVEQGPVAALQHRIDNICRQLWNGWELCIVADASCGATVVKALGACAAENPRIRMESVRETGLVPAFNHALGMAGGEYAMVLGQGTRLRRHTFLEMASLQHDHADAAFVYADEDVRTDGGKRHDPYFKPEWNPDLLRSQNYIGGLAMIRTDLLRAVGGLREGFGGSALHDLFLRCTERLPRSQVYHVPKVLYHRDREPAWSPQSERRRHRDADAARAVAEHMSRLGSDAHVEALPGDTFHVHWLLPTPRPKISVIIPTRDRVELLRTCVESILARTTWPNYEIVVVDNQSSDRDTLAYLDELRGHDHIRVLRDDTPFNYAAINNRAVARCDGELACLLNNDIEVISPHWLEEMAGHALRPDVGAVGAMLYYPDDTIQHAGVILGLHGVADHVYAGKPRGLPGHGGRARVAQELSAVTGACLLVRRSVYREAGGLDERLAVAFNDIDFCLRLREHGYHNIWTPHAELYHHESASRGRDRTTRQRTRYAGEVSCMRRRWATVMRADPAYSSNLSLRTSGGALACPPRIG